MYVICDVEVCKFKNLATDYYNFLCFEFLLIKRVFSVVFIILFIVRLPRMLDLI